MAKKKREDLVLVSAGGNAVQFSEKGQSVEGEFSHVEKGVGKNESNLYHFTDDKGAEYQIWGSANLDPLLGVAKKGDYIRVTYQGKTKTSAGYMCKTFQVMGSPSFAKRAQEVKLASMKANAGKKRGRKGKK